MAEPEKREERSERERDPNYKKKAQWFGLAAIGLLCLTLIISVFAGTGKRKLGDGPQTLPVDEQEPLRTQDSQQFLQEKIEQERLRLKHKNEKDHSNHQSPDQRMSDILADRADSQQGRNSEPMRGGGLSLEEEFANQEKRRALMARKGRFGLRRMNSMKQSGEGAETMPVQPVVFTQDKGLSEEQLRVQKELRRLGDLQKGQGRAAYTPVALNEPDQAEPPQEDPRNQVTVGRPVSQGEPMSGQKLIPTGTVISAVLDQKLMSDYTGPFRGLVSRDVYDVTGTYIMIPKGCRVTGRSLRISNVNEPIQARMGLTVRWFVLPDGKRISLERRVAALDQEGVPAIKDEVNYHFMAQFLGVAAYALLSSSTSYEGSGTDQEKSFEGNLSQSLREQFAPLAAKYLNLVPTITLNIGTPLNIFLEDDIYAYPWESLGGKLYKAF
jgi:type IV secretion system protein VirB10